MSAKLRVIFGVFPIAQWSKQTQEEFLSLLQKYGVKDIDTASVYPESEKTLGELGASQKFIIHTKAPAFQPGTSAKGPLEAGYKKSFEDLKTDKVETYYLHAPDQQTPIEETLDTIQGLYLKGQFERFGVSNFKAADVQRIHDYASSKGYVLPTVYQGNYNPVARHSEQELFPLLRKLGIRFYAYSPIAGGFLTKSASDFSSGNLEKGGRYDKDTMIGAMYHRLYAKQSLLNALSEWEAISRDSGVSKASLAYRWVTYNSTLNAKYGDAIILGARTPAQLEETLKAINEGPLEAKYAQRIDKIWDEVKDEAPIDNFQS